ncbi:hypothetical protein [[Clostridium] colinum]|uniref:hypothetical protein n=1 Tax=[Clostridium] colinum TaxID=36835 RepID=UPI00202437E7|nr:hypothetical protein [[Clostridium] colinum]
MKIFKINLISLIFVIFLFKCSTLADNLKIYSTYTVNNLTITSYSKSWTKNMLKDLYAELLNNFHGEEFDNLSDIYIYPNSPEGVNGFYYDNIYLEDNEYILGNNAYINIYNGDRLNTIPKIAYILSHEYGHHYMTYNLMKTENIYYHNLKDSNYVNIRKLEGNPVIYDVNKKDYLYHWDIMEIMADDYVQLLGSSTARKSYDFKSVDEILKNNEKNYDNIHSFNLKPQLNPYLPLAADVAGLYNYLISIGGFTVSQPKIPNKPKLNDITGYIGLNNEPTYNITWDNPNKNETFEYTLVIYPDDNPFVVYPLKTITSKEPLNVTFGSYSIKQKDGTIKSITQKYEGIYTLKLYYKDSLGFIHSSEPREYNFTEINKNIMSTNSSKKQVDKKAEPKPNNIINEKPSASPDNKVIGPSHSGSLSDLFSLVSKD